MPTKAARRLAGWLVLLALPLTAAPRAFGETTKCNRSGALSAALTGAIRAKMRVLDDPVRYCQLERQQLSAAQAFYAYIANSPQCFHAGEAKRRHALDLAEKAVEMARRDVAEDCR